MLKLTDANYGNALYVKPQDITAVTIVAETTYRDGMIPDGTFRRTLVYTVGGNQLAVRETPEEIMDALADRPAASQGALREIIYKAIFDTCTDHEVSLRKDGKCEVCWGQACYIAQALAASQPPQELEGLVRKFLNLPELKSAWTPTQTTMHKILMEFGAALTRGEVGKP